MRQHLMPSTVSRIDALARRRHPKVQMHHLPPPRHWLWFATIVGLAMLVSFAIASGRDQRSLRPRAETPSAALATSASGSTPDLELPPGCGDQDLRFCDHELN